MAKFSARYADLTWGKYDYPVTPIQKRTLEGLEYMMSGLPRTDPKNGDIPAGYFCSQRPDNGDVVIGLYNHSVSVNRNGRVTANR